jgi:hypothetical protein
MKIPTKEKTREILTKEVPNFRKVDSGLQELIITGYRLGYYDACNAASKIAAEHEAERAAR